MIEELLKQIPVTRLVKQNEAEFEAGLTFHWSVMNECWIVGHGKKVRLNDKGTGNGATLAFALKDFIEKQKQFK